jgi:hypothetical protein
VTTFSGRQKEEEEADVWDFRAKKKKKKRNFFSHLHQYSLTIPYST